MANLPIIQLQKLLDHQQDEAHRVLAACQEHGFFYLGFEDGGASDVLIGVDQLFCIFKEYFNKPLDTKLLDQAKCQKEAYVRG